MIFPVPGEEDRAEIVPRERDHGERDERLTGWSFLRVPWARCGSLAAFNGD